MAVGFAVMGFIGYFVKLIHIPMYVSFLKDDVLPFDRRPLRNNILVYVFLTFVSRRNLTNRNSGGA